MELPRSQRSEERSLVKFTNKSYRKVEVFWIGYDGRPTLYATLEHNQFIDVNTYVSHPWMFLDYTTKERLLVNGRTVFMPKRSLVQPYQNDNNMQVWVRQNVNIVQPLLTLRSLCIRIIKDHLRHDKEAFFLHLPKTLQFEIANAPPRKV